MTISRYKKHIILSAIILVFITIAAVCIIPYFYSNTGIKTMIYIRPDMDLKTLGDTLSIHYGNRFAKRTTRILSWMKVNPSSRCGAYTIECTNNPITTARKIRNYEQTPVRFTFNNLRLKEQFARRASEQLMMRQDDIMALLCDSSICASYDKTPATITNILLPDTYEVYWNISPKDLLNRLHRYYNRFWTTERIDKAKAIGLTPDEVHTLASIVEEETAKSDEMGTIARLYLNRLKRDMLLQADPTVKYAIGDFSIRRITKDMLATPSPYNTYLNAGLPPGPIRIASKEAIDAVLNAPQHNYLYMCARDDFSGYHNFTTSYSQHLVNAKRYQKALNQQGIK